MQHINNICMHYKKITKEDQRHTTAKLTIKILYFRTIFKAN